jgi:hypothetical protein
VLIFLPPVSAGADPGADDAMAHSLCLIQEWCV